MTAELVARLTDRERQCLRLVAQGYNTKEIALQLNIKDHRASKIIDSANQKLGVSRRIEAARLLAEYEGTRVNVLPGTTPTLPQTELPWPSDFVEETERVGRLKEDRSPYGTRDDLPNLPLSLRQRRGAHNGLGSEHRVIMIVVLAAAALLGTGSLIAALGSLSDNIHLVPTGGR